MYTQEEYLYGWLIYLVGVVLLMGCTWWITGRIQTAIVRQYLRLTALVFFLVPWYASPEMDYLAPAWIIAGFEGVFDGGAAFWRAGAPLLSCIGTSTVVIFLWSLGRRAWGK